MSLSAQKNSSLEFGVEDVLSVSWAEGIVNQIELQGRSYAGADLSGYGVVDSGDVVYTKSPLKDEPYGIVKTNRGSSGVVSQLYAVYRPLPNADPEFVEHYFGLADRLNRYFKPLVNKGAKNTMNISDAGALLGLVSFPPLPEQRAIGSFFSSVDDLIALHQRVRPVKIKRGARKNYDGCFALGYVA